MREILYRAKAINRDSGYHRTNYKNGDFVYGLVTRLYDERFENLPAVMTDTNGISGIEVDYSTIGQYTGLTDKNGTRIFEGDICKNIKTGKIVSVRWHGTFAGYCWSKKRDRNKYLYDFGELFRVNDYYEIIGNIYDTPELLKGEENE